MFTLFCFCLNYKEILPNQIQPINIFRTFAENNDLINTIMKKLFLSFYVFLGCFVLRLISDASSIFHDTSEIDDGLYHPTPFVKRLAESFTVLLDMIIMIPIALLIYHFLGEKNQYRVLITLLSSCAIYDIIFHVVKML